MIIAEKVEAKGKLWIKVKLLNYNPFLFNKMRTIKGCLYNKATGYFAIPIEYEEDFLNKMEEHLILWKDKNEHAVLEDTIPSTPIVAGYSVTYDDKGNIIDAQGFKTKPWGEFQVKGFNLLVQKDFLILADDAGLGKSWQVLNAIEAKYKLGQLKRGLIICKASLLYNWAQEIEKHSNLSYLVINGSKKERFEFYTKWVNYFYNIMVISYETFRMDLEVLRHCHSKVTFDFCVLDEAHKVKNPTSKIGSAIHVIPFKYKYVLTATPIINRPLEAYNYLRWGGVIKMSWWQFRNRYAEFGEYHQILYYKNIKELQQLLQKHMLRRLKKDKLKELPDVVFRIIPVEMTPEQRKLYNAIRKEVLDELENTNIKNIPSQLSKLLRLQQVTDSPLLIGSSIEGAKLYSLDELLENIIDENEEKCIVFSKFKSMVDILVKRYQKYNPAIVTGDVTNEERMREVNKFQTDETCKLFIGTSGACREGFTLTAATHVVFLDLEWAWSYIEQAYSRAHRIGQKDNVTVYFLLCKDTVDEKIYETVYNKKMINENMVKEIL